VSLMQLKGFIKFTFNGPKSVEKCRGIIEFLFHGEEE